MLKLSPGQAGDAPQGRGLLQADGPVATVCIWPVNWVIIQWSRTIPIGWNLWNLIGLAGDPGNSRSFKARPGGLKNYQIWGLGKVSPCVMLGTIQMCSGGFRNCTVANCTFRACRGLALEEVDGGILENITVNNISMMDVVNYARSQSEGRNRLGIQLQNRSAG
jgi:hypothetical protein